MVTMLLSLASFYLLVGWIIEIVRLVSARDMLLVQIGIALERMRTDPSVHEHPTLLRYGVLAFTLGFAFHSMKRVVLWPTYPIKLHEDF